MSATTSRTPARSQWLALVAFLSLWVVAAAAIPSAASGLWVFWRWVVERDDRRATETLTREQALMRDLDLQRTALGREHADLFDRVRAELLRTQARLQEVERDRDRGVRRLVQA